MAAWPDWRMLLRQERLAAVVMGLFKEGENRRAADLLPASGWGAVFEKDGREFAWPLIGWLRTASDEGSLLVGVTVSLDGRSVVSCDQIAGFRCYLPPAEWVQEAESEGKPARQRAQ